LTLCNYIVVDNSNVTVSNCEGLIFILWCINLFLGKDLGKHASAIIELLLERCFPLSPCKGVIRKTIGATQLVEFCTGGCEDGTCAREAEELLTHSTFSTIVVNFLTD
jgi:hypothetical protein